MTNRARHYHLGCGESLFTHYSLLCNEQASSEKSQLKNARQLVQGKIQKKRSKG